MALLPDRDYYMQEDITRSWDINETVAQAPGGVASLVVSTSGAGLGTSLGSGITAGLQVVNTVSYVANPSGAIPIGVMMDTVVIPSEPTRYFKNFDKLTVFAGEKVTLCRRGWIVTDKIKGTPVAGGVAYLGSSGLISTDTPTGVNIPFFPVVGKFETYKDEGGFVRVYITL